MRKILLPFLLFLFCFAWTSTALAEVQVRLRVIGASNDKKGVDSALNDIYKELGSLFNFTSYRLWGDENLTLSPNQPVSIATRKRLIEITLVGLRKDIAELKIKVVREEKELLNTQVRLSPGKTVLIGGGPRSREGIIIYALYARFKPSNLPTPNNFTPSFR
jgi:hypothetical protein